jgi:hypothetical protein
MLNLPMRYALKLHPDSRCDAVTHIDVEVTRHAGNLVLRYLVNGMIDDLCLPPAVAPSRADELWKHTCFEAFVRAASDGAYFEFNFSPSTDWAAYRFSGYRSGMTAVQAIAPKTELRRTADILELQARLELDRLSDLPACAPWELGLSAVMEETNGRKSYWALTHPPGKADFHHSDCFALELPPASRA